MVITKIDLKISNQNTCEIYLNQDIFINYTVKNKILMVMDENIYKLYSSFFTSFGPILVTKVGEKNKSFNQYLSIINYLFENHYHKDDYLIGIGGGVVTDLVSFAASNYKRGIKLALIPTSLLAMVDASIGGKNGINFHDVKNMLGSFYLPEKIFINYEFLNTLPDIEWKNGLIEILKIGVILDKEIFSYFENDTYFDNIDKVIINAVRHKCQIIKKDPFDKNIRMCLNFGHTFGHALESYYHLSHGQAVALGMLIVSKDKPYFKTLKKIIKNIGLKNTFKFDQEAIMHLISHDKKINQGGINLILSDEIGSFYFKKEDLPCLYQYVKDGKI